jgi:hypothetical protein
MLLTPNFVEEENLYELSHEIGKARPSFRWLTDVGHNHFSMFVPRTWTKGIQSPYWQMTDITEISIYKSWEIKLRTNRHKQGRRERERERERERPR